jgi:hypothetical protein
MRGLHINGLQSPFACMQPRDSFTICVPGMGIFRQVNPEWAEFKGGKNLNFDFFDYMMDYEPIIRHRFKFVDGSLISKLPVRLFPFPSVV